MALNIIDILHDCKLFSLVPEEGFRRLATMARIYNFRKGQLIFREHEDCPGVYIVGTGQVRVFKTGSGGKEHVLHIVGPGETFAEVAAIGGFGLPASAEAIVKSTCVLLPFAPFRKLLDDDPATTKAMLLGLTHWVRHLVNLMEDIVLRDAAGRIARLLLDAKPVAEGPVGGKGSVGGTIVKLPGLKRHLASHLNLTSETFSRTFRRLIDAGVIAEGKNNRVELLDKKALRRVAEGMFPTI
jgi:CRP/FNR family transcriptional regulator, dissimilatory nitrate respiration regulator